jgi:mono/diheme cytochrome c family protein
MMQWIVSFCAAMIFSLSLSATVSAQAKGDANAGKAKYESLCAGCHGKTGKGDGPAAASLNPKPQDHTDGKVMNSLTDQYLTDIIKNGGSAVKKSALMPAWGKTLNDQDVANVIAYIRSIANPPYKAGK